MNRCQTLLHELKTAAAAQRDAWDARQDIEIGRKPHKEYLVHLGVLPLLWQDWVDSAAQSEQHEQPMRSYRPNRTTDPLVSTPQCATKFVILVSHVGDLVVMSSSA